MSGSYDWRPKTPEEWEAFERENEGTIVRVPSEVVDRIYSLAENGHPDEAERELRKLRLPKHQMECMLCVIGQACLEPGHIV